jgi:hypothetical protein
MINEKKSDATRASVYRYDAKDAPRDWNVDHYDVIFDLASDNDLPNLVSMASTKLDNNLYAYINQNNLRV